MIINLENKNPRIIGLLQALGISIYCGLVASFFFIMSHTIPEPPGFFGFFLMLSLFVFSAAVTGSLVFGYPVYLALVKNKIKEAFTILAYTLIFILVLILVTTTLIFTFA